MTTATAALSPLAMRAFAVLAKAPANSFVPSELAVRLGSSRPAILRALEELAAQGRAKRVTSTVGEGVVLQAWRLP